MMMNIGAFQLENLHLNRVQFQLWSVVDGEQDTLPSMPAQSWLAALTQQTRTVQLSEGAKHIEQHLPDKEQPVVLISRDGRVAEKLGQTLVDKGFSNIFVVEGGWLDLLKVL